MEMLRAQCKKGRGLCVGLDCDVDLIPKEFKEAHGSDLVGMVTAFARDRIWQTHEFACAYMADHNFYLEHGAGGLSALQQIIASVHTIAPGVPFILGSYAGGVYHSNVKLARYAFDTMHADGITVNPWFGQEALEPLLSRSEKGVFVVCRTSNYGAAEFQDLLLAKHDDVPLYKTVAFQVATYWNDRHNCALLMGPMAYGELAKVRDIVNHLPIFVTGIGSQGPSHKIEDEDVREIIVNGGNGKPHGSVVCSSRGVIFAPGIRGPHDEAARLHGLIAKHRVARQTITA
ncbi:MAG: orotidine-5'-phosphate decarboxylase [Candidatus Staskawiczbacteria bacterium]|nr:orotidine-5'-phosphate decarboxylase [Candidatus Staskawiczbacteria bacterium]